ncbi:homoserine dehydrogenase [Bythopirellula polymerisocia]|uniref:Homoserine dehydrogenase n=1 Tax=Bythopirellula polymerisocia TaxID=2528003 RepID=A0A5C6CXD6_9BACT|nr:homoserine dehydrogenase [Bythopirellula polymerisocia]TWU28545.1 Homoserine dehydrogenase [Bythopirellula polymerisocia]
MDKTKVGIIGLGTVGSGVARLLLDFGDRTGRHAGRTLWLEKAVVRDLAKARDCDLPASVLTDDIEEVLNHPEIEVVAQLIGGLEPARTIMLKLLESGKDVVTANKALLAQHGPELFDRARELGRSIAFEASVAGGIPIIANIGQCLSANQIESLFGILNGTSNFILSKMHEDGAAYADVLAEAQRLGYAEADPTMDVDGADAAQKLAILAHLAFGARVDWQDIPRTGIDKLDVADVRYAQEMGYKIKLLAVAQLVGDGLELHVSPTLVKAGTPLAEVGGPFNAIRVVGDAVGPLLFYGAGAGQMPTASAVVADLIDTAVGRTKITFKTLELWSNRQARVTANDYAQAKGRFYLRANVVDHPGVLAQIATALGRQQVSIASVLQHEAEEGSQVLPLVIMTHETTEGAAAKACEEIAAFKSVQGDLVRMWVRG